MHLPRFLRRNRTVYRRLTAGLLLVAIVAGTTGVPLPSWASKDTSVPFPCMHRKCGCRNAAACWNSCCCHTNAQKLAWAKKHGVQAPGFVVAAAERDAGAGSPSVKTASCCASKLKATTASCCSTNSAAKANKSCCTSSKSPEAKKLRGDWLVLEDARRCHGQAELWLMLGQALPPAAELQPDCEPLAQDWLVLHSATAEILFSSPGERPPKAFL
jgi:hypothetical protein